MALLNNIYIFVKDEEISRSSKIPQHPVEKGLPLTDNVREEPVVCSISGKIVNTDKLKASDIISKINKLRKSGSLITYSGRNIVGNFLIKTFDTSHPNTNWGGADFDMEIVECRIAKSAYDPKAQTKAEATKKTTNPTLEVGAIVVFKGGPVYVSSDATRPAATRGRSTCKITKISTQSWSIHQYHLISTDGGKVYGWVDGSNIEGGGTSSGTTKTNTSATTNSGTQQKKNSTTTTASTKNTTQTGTPNNTKVRENNRDKDTMPANYGTLVYIGKLKQKLIVGSHLYCSKLLETINGEVYTHSGKYYYPNSYRKNYTYDGGRSKGQGFPKGTPYYIYRVR